jgi:hypothetical protein
MNLKNRIVATVAVAALAIPALAYAKVSKDKSDKEGFAKFNVPLTAGSIDGEVKDKGKAISVTEDGADTVITVDLRNVTTGIDLRNGHFQDMIKKVKLNKDKDGKERPPTDAGKDLVLKVPTASIVKDDKEHTVKGKLDTKADGDTSQEVTITYKAKKDGDKVKVTGSTSFDYTILYPAQTYLGIGAKPKVTVTAEFSVNDK